MKRLLSKVSLARLTLAVWLAWLATIVIMAWLSLSGVLHPSFLYMAIPLAFMLFCTLGLVLGGIWRLVRGPGRYRAVVWILVGVLPGLLTAAYVEHLFLLVAAGNIRPTWPLRASRAVTSLVAEPYVRMCYPHRHEGRRCVMWSASPERNDVVLAQMDDHIEHMETLLGEQSDEKVYWVCGPVWGLCGLYGVGWILGWEETGERLTSGNRHEAAHFALNQLLPPDHELPLLFQEGWATAYSGGDGVDIWHNCLQAQHVSQRRDLRELLTDDAYYRSDDPMYHQGCFLVDYLLRRFGHARFLEFCRTCREATFDDDLRRVFGVSLDGLEQTYQEGVTQYDSLDQWLLLSAELDEGVDPEQWRELAERYCAGAKRLKMAFRQSSVDTLCIGTERFRPDAKKQTIRQSQSDYLDGARSATVCDYELRGARSVTVRTPEGGFEIFRDNPHGSWQLIGRRRSTCDYEALVATNRLRLDFLQRVLLPLDEQSKAVTVESIGPSPSDPRLIRLVGSIPGICEEDGANGWWDLDPRFDYAVVATKMHFDCGYSGQATTEYQTVDGRTVPKTTHYRGFHPDGTLWLDSTLEIKSCRFGPPPPEVFELSSYGDLRPEDAISSFQPYYDPDRVDRKIGPATWTAFGWTIATVLAGLMLPIRRAFGGR